MELGEATLWQLYDLTFRRCFVGAFNLWWKSWRRVTGQASAERLECSIIVL